MSRVSGASGRPVRAGSSSSSQPHPGVGLRQAARGFRLGGQRLVPASAQVYWPPLPGREFPTAWARGPAATAARAAFLGGIMDPLLHSQLTWTVEGSEVFADLGEQPALIVANHASHLDATVLLCALPPAVRERTVVTAAADYFFESTWRGLSTALAFGTVPIDRSGGAPSTTPVDLLRDGWNLVIFPEGTRSPDGARGRFKLGAAFLSINTGVPVVPVGLRGTFAAMPRGRSWPVPGRPEVSVRFGRPLRPGEGDDVRGLTARLAAEVDRLVTESETSWWASLPRPGRPTPPPGGTRAAVPAPGGGEPARWRKVWAATEPPAPTRPRSPWGGS
ncbi:lysophospholipid acyltransferase family protein [Pseudofrankia sp. BMG5.37]|uniref:lysophospholipid acyltransferase family protein n=1 Tax=Pseudofrankia sp. BMG5.37 TaxID=3050035 RepID=UPI0028954AC9|nr:lysophospholipid acyltransferase family protein [Pseudofrankia sp. BMG5.37]MDT3441601.1 lysophospholipid acyltransferase family protein [Pseudofrankia sp. BMG5.37]